jgi:hypothetical protein
MDYSDVVRVLYELTDKKMIRAPLVLQPSTLIQRVAGQRIDPGDPGPDARPETGQPEGRAENAKAAE